MQQAINLTLNRNFKIRNFEEDKTATLNANPGFKYNGEVNNYYKFSGSFYLKNELGDLIESFSIAIGIDKKKYPNTFPVLFSTDDKIKKHEDFHIDPTGIVCLEHTYIVNKLALGSIRLYDFVNHYLPKYFSWVLVKKYGRCEILEEWGHQEKGTIQFYQELLKTKNDRIIFNFIEQYCDHPKLQRNGLCYCGSNLKLKKCHYEAAILLKSTPKKVLLSDLRLFKKGI